MPKKPVSSFRLSPEAKKVVAKLALKMGIGKSAVVETAIRRMGGEKSL